MRANEYQVGGDHYGGGDFQHWDLVVMTGMGYLEGTATKYLSRWRRKGGKADLEKALHYVRKLRECCETGAYLRAPCPLPGEALQAVVVEFGRINALYSEEVYLIQSLSDIHTSDWEAILPEVEARIHRMIVDSGADPVPATEENHYADRAPPSQEEQRE